MDRLNCKTLQMTCEAALELPTLSWTNSKLMRSTGGGSVLRRARSTGAYTADHMPVIARSGHRIH